MKLVAVPSRAERRVGIVQSAGMNSAGFLVGRWWVSDRVMRVVISSGRLVADKGIVSVYGGRNDLCPRG